MEISKFNQIFNDKHAQSLKKLKHKYSDDFEEYMSVLREMYYEKLSISDFAGKNIVFIPSCCKVNMSAFKTLISAQERAYGEKAVEDEIISTAKIESIDYSRESVRNILKGYAPKDEIEKRILGMKNGFEFIADKNNIITKENIYKLYAMAVGDYLDEESQLKKGSFYRHDDVFVVSAKLEHTGMNHSKIEAAMDKLIAFINAKDDIDELAKAAMIHFYIGYIHPYFDGNGRMARLMHLWYLVQKGYGTTLFIPFSSYISKSVKNYYDAYTVTEENKKESGVIDLTPFVKYFSEFVYDKLSEYEVSVDVFEKYKLEVSNGSFTEKETQLWQFVVSRYGTESFSTKQLEKDFSDAAYATIRSFVLKFEKLGFLSSTHYGNRVKYKIVE